MSARITRTQMLSLLVTLALSFAVAGCASQQQAGEPAPGATTEAAAQPQATPPEATGTQEQAAQPSAEAPSASQQRMGSERTALGDKVEIRRPWVQVRNQPSQDARAIALAFGNDTFTVLEQQGDWVRVRLDKSREGWIPVAATQGN